MTERSIWSGLGVAASLVAVGLMVYQPWVPTPLDTRDFSEFLPFLRRSGGLAESFAATGEYFRGHGRSNIGTSGLIALTWELFGENPLAWRALRAVLMLAAAGLTVGFLRRVGVGRLGAVTAGLAMVVWPAAAGNWTRLTGEPMAMILLLGSLNLAARYREAASWVTYLAGLTSGMVGLLLMKETMIATIPFVVVMGVCWDDERRTLGRPERSIRTGMLVGASILVCVGWSVLALRISASIGQDAYVSSYGASQSPVGRFIAYTWLLWIPVLGSSLAHRVVVGLYWALLAVGIAALARRSAEASRESRLKVVLFFAAMPLAGGAIYAPWHRFELFYGVPFVLGAVATLALAVDGLRERGLVTVLAMASVVAILLSSAFWSNGYSNRTAALRRAEHSVVEALAASSDRHLIVAIDRLPSQPWQGRAATLARASLLADSTFTVRSAADSLCGPAAELAFGELEPATLVVYRDGCGPIAETFSSVEEEFTYWKMGELRIHRDTIRIDLVMRN